MKTVVILGTSYNLVPTATRFSFKTTERTVCCMPIPNYLGSLVALTNESGAVLEKYAYDAWGKRRNPSDWRQADTRTSWKLNRGYTGHEHLDMFGFINMNGRMFDPLTASFFSPDPYVQAPGNWMNYNRYAYCLNNPFLYTDPSGEFFWLIPNIGWSKKGGLSIGLTAVVGIPGIASAQAGVGYNFKNNDAYVYAGASAAFNTLYTSYSNQSGWNTGWSAGLSPYMGFPISTNFTSMGINYNITHNAWSGNLSAWQFDRSGGTFNPSFSAMIFPEHTTNLARGQGFRSNNNVLQRFVNNGQQQRALDYFGFEGIYDPSIEDPGQFKPSDGSIRYNDVAFSNGYDYLRATYQEEMFHKKDYLIYKSKAPGWMIDEEVHNFEEWRAQNYLYKSQGLYLNSGKGWVDRINSYGIQAGLYDQYTPLFSPKWWHFVYKIPRKW